MRTWLPGSALTPPERVLVEDDAVLRRVGRVLLGDL